MRQVLVQIPLDRPWDLGPLGKVPGFGFGVVLFVWILIGAGYLYLRGRKSGWKLKLSDEFLPFVNWLAVALAIVFGAPLLGSYLRSHGSENFREGIPIFGYGLMLFIGFSLAVFRATIRAEREGLPSDVIWDLAVWLFIPGIVGARLYYLIQYGDRVFTGPPSLDWLIAAVSLSQGGIVLYGGLLGGAIGYFSFCYFRGIRPLALADIIVPSVFIGIGFGRIGCFLNGCCYGAMTSLPWAVQFPRESATFASMVEKKLLDASAVCTPPLHPTQIYSAIDGFVIAAITAWYFRYRRRNGEVLAVALLIYPITRFCMELLRADEGGQFSTSLTTAQWVSIALFIVNLGFMYYLSTRPAVREPVTIPPASTGVGSLVPNGQHRSA
ncbi:prolipoprotein diacylglyceryl transferase [Schlesneria sp. DSM 10557]|uniref:prolipoprotein diacylglyceryl transferase n=1 Tax=Schlesneria sp. DSM 10557 TaxID=3044399 RepID=UPI00359FB89C